jgi:hypothetical protein
VTDGTIDGFIGGMTWGWVGTPGSWATPEAEASLVALAASGANWVALAYAAVQETAQSTEIPFETTTVSDDELRWAIRRAHELGLRVCLKPVVNVGDGTWRAHIGFLDPDVPGEPTWGEWFASYRLFLTHAARIAQEEAVELLCIGCEMVRSDAREADWRGTIAAIRKVYAGPLTYNCDKYQEDRLAWWDAVDVISSSGYYPAGQWETQLDRIETVVRREGKPFFFAEAGCSSRAGSAQRPNDWTLAGAPSEREQAEYYREMFAATEARDWVGGFLLWDWPAELYAVADAASNTDYCPYGKEAEQVMRDYYARRS